MTTRTILITLPLIGVMASCSNIPNAREAEVTINGNCEQCEETIEKAALVAGVSEADWDKDTRHATITYDSTKTSLNAVLQRIANAGYDNQEFIASDSAYDDLPECCQYKRTGNVVNPPSPEDTRHGH
ncbi:MAG TPA: cation transporter [Flavobacteriales bacterium]|nr:cation transporter [Flavobacteriales bacterium]